MSRQFFTFSLLKSEWNRAWPDFTILPDPKNPPALYHHFLFWGEYSYFRTLITEFLHLMQWSSVHNLCFPLTYPMKVLASWFNEISSVMLQFFVNPRIWSSWQLHFLTCCDDCRGIKNSYLKDSAPVCITSHKAVPYWCQDITVPFTWKS